MAITTVYVLFQQEVNADHTLRDKEIIGVVKCYTDVIAFTSLDKSQFVVKGYQAVVLEE